MSRNLATPSWSVGDVPDQGGRVAIVTGANSGIGWHTARALAAKGASVVMTCRSFARAKDPVVELCRRVPRASVALMKLDLADLASVREFAAEFTSRYGALDILCNNAGVMAVPLAFTRDGFEAQFGTNHLGHFALTGLLLPALLRAPGSRVVTVSSLMHRRGRMDFDKLDGERGYSAWGAYARSKLANLMFALELDRRLRGARLPVVSCASHPGYAATNLQLVGARKSGSRLRVLLTRAANALLAQSAEHGALTTLYAATSPAVAGGDYIGPGGRREWRGSPIAVAPAEHAQDREVAAALWQISEQLTGVRYLSALAGRPGEPGGPIDPAASRSAASKASA